MLAEAEEIGLVLRPPAVEVQLVLVDHCLAQPLDLVELRPGADRHAGVPLLSGAGCYATTVDLESIGSLGQSLDREHAVAARKRCLIRSIFWSRRSRQALIFDAEA